MKVPPTGQSAYSHASRQAQIKGQVPAGGAHAAAGGLPKDSVSLTEMTDSKTLIQRTLLESIGARFEAMLNAEGLSLSDAAGQDWSAEAVSQRIVDFTTGFFGMFRQQNPNLSDEEAVGAFEKLVRGSVDKGAKQAMDVLAGNGMDGPVKSLVGETMALVHKKLDGFFSSLRQQFTAVEEG